MLYLLQKSRFVAGYMKESHRPGCKNQDHAEVKVRNLFNVYYRGKGLREDGQTSEGPVI